MPTPRGLTPRRSAQGWIPLSLALAQASIVMAVFALVGCGSTNTPSTAGPAEPTEATGSTRNVFFDDRTPHVDPNVASVYFDRYGDLYPSAEVEVDEHSFYRNRRGAAESELRIASTFEEERDENTATWSALLAESATEDPDPDATFGNVWKAVQQGLRERHVTEIEELVRQDDGSWRPLVVLIHGFNNVPSEAREWYEPARERVLEHAPDAAFLDVYWDGLSADVAISAWKRAQYNFPLIGLELRRLLNSLDPAIPLRMITHSSGGPLAASTLGNASAPLPAKGTAYIHYLEQVENPDQAYSPPHPEDFRVAMIVPAMSSITFENFDADVEGPDRLIIGINEQDYVIAKFGLPCEVFGSTCGSASEELYCRDVAPKLAEIPDTEAYVFDFGGTDVGRPYAYQWYEEHAMVAYLEREDMERVLTLLLEDDVSDEGEAGEICP